MLLTPEFSDPSPSPSTAANSAATSLNGTISTWIVSMTHSGEPAQLVTTLRSPVEAKPFFRAQRITVPRLSRVSCPGAPGLHQWLVEHRRKVPEGSATARAIGYSLNRWAALTRYIDDGHLPIDNHWGENQIRPIAIGRNNWLFAGSLRAGERAAAIMSLLHSARLNGHDPYAYLRDILERLPTQPASRIGELLPHRWTPCPGN